MFAHLANLPGLPPVKLGFNGFGALDNFDAASILRRRGRTSGRGATSRSCAKASDGNSRSTSTPRLEGMAPAHRPPGLCGRDDVSKGDLYFDDDLRMTTPGLHMVSANARLDIAGGRSADDLVGLKIHAGALFRARRRSESSTSTRRSSGPS